MEKNEKLRIEKEAVIEEEPEEELINVASEESAGNWAGLLLKLDTIDSEYLNILNQTFKYVNWKL